MCRVCRRPLDAITTSDPNAAMRWAHTLQDQLSCDHDPEPVRAADTGGEVVGRCDFCNAPGPEWVYPCRNFSIDESGFVGDWAACSACRDDIDAGRWGHVVGRNIRDVLSVYPAFTEVHVAVSMRVEMLFNEFKKYRSGPPVPLHERRR